MIGDVAGHGIEPSITAFQVKYLLRTFLRQYRDPAQALEELNKTLSTLGPPEDLVSLCIVIFDTEAGTMRHASAGHPPALVWRRRRDAAAQGHRAAAGARPQRDLFSRDLAARDRRPRGDVHRRPHRSPLGGQIFGEDRVATSCGVTPARTPPSSARRCSKRPGTFRLRSSTTSPSLPSGGSERRRLRHTSRPDRPCPHVWS